MNHFPFQKKFGMENFPFQKKNWNGKWFIEYIGQYLIPTDDSHGVYPVPERLRRSSKMREMPLVTLEALILHSRPVETRGTQEHVPTQYLEQLVVN